jgi:hypothetical protein
MPTYYVETYRPAYPERGVHVRAIRGRDFAEDCLSPTMTTVHAVHNVTTKEEAIACVIEHAAGLGTDCRLTYGGRRDPKRERVNRFAPDMLELLESLYHQLNTDSDLDQIAGAQKYADLVKQIARVIAQADPTNPQIRYNHDAYQETATP